MRGYGHTKYIGNQGCQMAFKDTVRRLLVPWITSEAFLKLRRRVAGVNAVLKRQPREILYFHRADDPYCQLLVQVIPDLVARFNMPIKPLVVERLPADMYPDPERYEAYTIIDAGRLARLFGLGFSGNATVPDRLAVGMANRFLASKQEDPDFYSIAEEVGAALWKRDLDGVRRLCGMADLGEDQLARNEATLRALGHYASATLYYRGEFYAGLDRVDHLERRLRDEGVGDGRVSFSSHRYWRKALKSIEPIDKTETVEFFFSPRSPYSYLGLCYIKELANAGVSVELKPVLPMLMRGMKVPPKKSMYILLDTAREARLNDLPFGKIVDPLGEATWRALEMGYMLMDAANEGHIEPHEPLEFFLAFAKGVWSQGIDGSTDSGLTKILASAGLDGGWLKQSVSRELATQRAEANVNRMFRLGSWGVPTMHVGGATMWGQDRMWVVVEKLKQDGTPAADPQVSPQPDLEGDRPSIQSA